MTWLLFMDESGHDHKNMPFEVRGGVALHASKVWPFVCDFQQTEKDCFGVQLADYSIEIKGSKLLEVKRFAWANQMNHLHADVRHKSVRRFLTKKSQNNFLKKRDFAAYGQASILMAHTIFDLLDKHEAVLFASLIRCGCKPPEDYQFEHFLRKDHIFLQERFFYFLEWKADYGIFVMDQTEKQNDKRFVRRLRDYYTKTHTGRQRTQWIIPEPLFVDSEMSVAVQAADLCLYCINWGFRVPNWNFTGRTREEIHWEFGGRIGQLQFKGDGYNADGHVYQTRGIIYVPDPYTARGRNE